MKELNSELYDLTHDPHYSFHNKILHNPFPLLLFDLFVYFICFFSFTFPFVWEVVLRAEGNVGRQEDTWDHDQDVKSARINKFFFKCHSS